MQLPFWDNTKNARLEKWWEEELDFMLVVEGRRQELKHKTCQVNWNNLCTYEWIAISCVIVIALRYKLATFIAEIAGPVTEISFVNEWLLQHDLAKRQARQGAGNSHVRAQNDMWHKALSHGCCRRIALRNFVHRQQPCEGTLHCTTQYMGNSRLRPHFNTQANVPEKASWCVAPETLRQHKYKVSSWTYLICTQMVQSDKSYKFLFVSWGRILTFWPMCQRQPVEGLYWCAALCTLRQHKYD